MQPARSSDNSNLKPCPFCKKEFSNGDDMGNHLVQCASKTEKCSHCNKYIQRSFFNYHQDNECAYLSPDNNVRMN